MMKRICVHSLIVLILASQVLSAHGFAKAQTPSGSEKDRVERLAGLAKLWGAIKYFHPYLAYKEIDWDGALARTIPKVNVARSPEQYSEAINHLLSFLHDPATQAKIEPGEANKKQPPANPASATQPDFIREVNGVTVITVMSLAKLMMADQTKASQLTAQLPAALNKAKAVVLDCRGEKSDEGDAVEFSSYYFNNALRNALSQMADGPVTLGSKRYRIHSGYATQTGGSSGGYYSGFTTAAPETLGGLRSKGNRLPLAILINDATPDSSDSFSGFQKAGLATVIQEGSGETDSGSIYYSMKLPGLSVRIRTSEFINPDGRVGFMPDAVIAKTGNPAEDAALAAAIKTALQPPPAKAASVAEPLTVMRSNKDNAYPEMKYPSMEYRLLALFRFWNVINYFFPYKHLLDEPWDNVLINFIPQFEADKDQIEYQKTVREVVTQIRDSHGFIVGVNEFDRSLGTFHAPLLLSYAEGQVFISKLLDEAAAKAAGLAVGDVILAIDGNPIAKCIEGFGQLFASSTSQATRFRAMRSLLAGAQASHAKLSVRGADGQTREVELERKMPAGEYGRAYFDGIQRKTPIYEILPSGFGYIDLARLPFADADKAMDAMTKTPAIIFDMRGYPNGTAWKIGPRLTTKKKVIGAQFRRPILEGITLGSSDYSAGTGYIFEQPLPPSTGEAYSGKVVMLINETAISQAEHTCLFFEAATDVTFIGSPTNGANGDVTTMILPGDIKVNFSGHDVRHADGRQLQRVGIQPHVKAEPTIRGIREGRDEVLESAIKFLQGVRSR